MHLLASESDQIAASFESPLLNRLCFLQAGSVRVVFKLNLTLKIITHDLCSIQLST